MKRYVNGVMTGALVGAVVTGVWLLRRSRPRPSIWRSARQLGPKMARLGHQGVRVVQRRMR